MRYHWKQNTLVEKQFLLYSLVLPLQTLMIIYSRLILLILLFGVVTKLSAQAPRIKSIGVPPITTFGPSEHDFGIQTFSLAISTDQKIYTGSTRGVLVYNNHTWTKVPVPKQAVTYGLAQTDDGTVYVGAINEIGYLGTLPNGELNYISLNEKLDQNELVGISAAAWKLGNEILFFDAFLSSPKCFLFDPIKQSFQIIQKPVNSVIQISQDKLYAYSNDSIFYWDKSRWLAERKTELHRMSEFGHGFVIDLDSNTSIVINQNGFYDFKTEVKISKSRTLDDFLSACYIYSVALIKEKYIAICTSKGLLITNRFGQPIKLLNKQSGLPDDIIYQARLDASDILWLATNAGIASIDVFSPFSILGTEAGISGLTTDAQLHNDQLYVSSMSGIFKESWKNVKDPFVLPQFSQFNPSIFHGMINTTEELVFFTEVEKNLILSKGKTTNIEGTEEEIYWAGFKDNTTNNIILGSEYGSLLHLSKHQGKWTKVQSIDLAVPEIHFMVQGSDNDIWTSHYSAGLSRLAYDQSDRQVLDEKVYGQKDGLPSDLHNYFLFIGGKPCAATEQGIYLYDPKLDRFSPDPRFNELIGNEPLNYIKEDENGNVYYITEQLYKLVKEERGYRKIAYPHFDFKKYIPERLTSVDSSNFLISAIDAVIHVDPNPKSIPESFDVNISKLSSLAIDTAYYGGYGTIPLGIMVPYDQSSLTFEFSANFNQSPKETRYSWKLDGEDWSDWSDHFTKDYTNLSHGEHTFYVQAKNAYNKICAPTSISFTVTTPWFFTVWAYLGYIITFLLLIWVIVKMYTRKIRAHRDRLEKVIEERTVEINEQKNELLKMDDLKKRFFVNISHELRTPLTLSMGTVDQALKGSYGALNDELYSNLQVSKRNSERLLKMVTSILDISKLEGGRIQLYAALIDPAEIVRKVLAFFSSRLEDKRINLKENLIHGNELYIDQDKFETILINLLSNAFKFTPDGGVISFSMKDMRDEMIFEIKDSGSGIPESDLNLVFDRFYQSPTIKSGEGMGVGLALTKELVELHHGTVGAKNDGGAVFTLTFPKGKDHFTPNQIVDHQESTTSINLADKYPLHDDRSITLIPEKEHDSHAEHILLVEDNIEMRQFISGILSPHYDVSWAEDGAKGLEFLKETKPDLIITDYLMPHMDGYEMATEIKKTNELAFIPIVFLTARAREQDKINVLNLGVDDYLYKPFSTDELLVRVKNLLFNKKHRAEYIEEQEIDSSEIAWKEFDSKLKQDIDSYIQEHIKSEITGDDLAKIAGHSERSLYRKVKANTGLTLMLYVKEYRLRQARSLLENKELPTVSEVSYAVGFNYLSHFTKNYKERFGKNPSEYLE